MVPQTQPEVGVFFLRIHVEKRCNTVRSDDLRRALNLGLLLRIEGAKLCVGCA